MSRSQSQICVQRRSSFEGVPYYKYSIILLQFNCLSVFQRCIYTFSFEELQQQCTFFLHSPFRAFATIRYLYRIVGLLGRIQTSQAKLFSLFLYSFPLDDLGRSQLVVCETRLADLAVFFLRFFRPFLLPSAM